MRPAAVIHWAICLFITLIVLGSTALAFGIFTLFREDSTRIALRLPAPKIDLSKIPYVPIKGELTRGTGIPSQISTSWSQFRGENRNAVSPETLPLRKDWNESQTPPVLWEQRLGEGYAGFAVRNGRVYITDYDEENQRDALRCLSLDDGQEIWRFSYPVQIKKNHGMSRTIPAVTDQYCVSLGPKCHVLCTDAKTGAEKWFIDLKHQFGTEEPAWYAGQCPLIITLPGSDKPSAIIAPAGPDALLVALDCETGQEVWRTPNPFAWTMAHTSIAPMMLDGKSTFVYFAGEGLAGVDAADGKILWSTRGLPVGLATCPSPVILPDNRVFCSGGYKSGSVMLKIVPDSGSGAYKAETLWKISDKVFDSEQQTPIFYEGHLFGLRQDDKRFVCLNLEGKIVWESGRTERFGSGPSIIADGMLLILSDDGKLTGCEATSSGYKKLFAVQILDDFCCWAPMALVEGRLLLRDQFAMKCVNLRK